MILDERSEFADATAVTLAAGTNIIGDVIDLTGSGLDLGQARVYLVIQVDTAFAGGTSFQFILASDAQAAITTDGTESRHYLSDVFTDAQLTAGKFIVVPLPAGDAAGQEGYERYLGILGVGVGTHTAGSINAFLTLDPVGWKSYPDGARLG